MILFGLVKTALHPAAIGALIGTPLGAGIGYLGTDDEDKKLRNALIGGGIGGGLGMGMGELLRSLGNRATSHVKQQIASDPYWKEKERKLPESPRPSSSNDFPTTRKEFEEKMKDKDYVWTF